MGLKAYFFLKKKNLISKLKKIKATLRVIKNTLYIKSREKNSDDIIETSHKNVTINNQNLEKYSSINTPPNISLPSSKVTDKAISLSSLETPLETEKSRKTAVVPEGSRVLSISLIKGKIMEKVYLTPDGKKISLKGSEP